MPGLSGTIQARASSLQLDLFAVHRLHRCLPPLQLLPIHLLLLSFDSPCFSVQLPPVLLQGPLRFNLSTWSHFLRSYTLYTVTMVGFDFSNHNRNLALHARGVPLPKATSTGTTIVGCVYDKGVVVSS